MIGLLITLGVIALVIWAVTEMLPIPAHITRIIWIVYGVIVIVIVARLLLGAGGYGLPWHAGTM